MPSYPPDIMDRVVENLLFRNIVSNEQVAEAYKKRETLHKLGVTQPAWRILAMSPDVNRDNAYAVAAQCFSYKDIVKPEQELKDFITNIKPVFSGEQWRHMCLLGVLPVNWLNRTNGRQRWVFGAYDPTSKEIHQLARAFSRYAYEVRFASHSLVTRLVRHVYPLRNEKRNR